MSIEPGVAGNNDFESDAELWLELDFSRRLRRLIHRAWRSRVWQVIYAAPQSGKSFTAMQVRHESRPIGSSGDGGPATAAQLYAPYAVAVARDGTLYVADTYNHRVRKVDTAGIITTIAGTGTAGFAGDGGPGTAAQLNEPRGLFVDARGQLYIADSVNNRVRLLSAAGTITTIAGDGGTQQLQRPTAVIVGTDGIYIADAGNHRIVKRKPLG